MQFIDPEVDEAGYYREVLNEGLRTLCEALGVDTDKYDRDQADGACYLDCFQDAAKVLKQAGVRFDEEEWGWVINPPLLAD